MIVVFPAGDKLGVLGARRTYYTADYGVVIPLIARIGCITIGGDAGRLHCDCTSSSAYGSYIGWYNRNRDGTNTPFCLSVAIVVSLSLFLATTSHSSLTIVPRTDAVEFVGRAGTKSLCMIGISTKCGK